LCKSGRDLCISVICSAGRHRSLMTAVCVAGPRSSFVASMFGLSDACFAYLLTILQVPRALIYFASQAYCTCSIWVLKWCPCSQLLLASISRHLLSPHLIPLMQFHASVAVWPNHRCRHTRKTNLHLPGAHQWSRIRPSRLVQTLAATASRLTFAVLCPMLHCVFAEFTNQLATCWKIYGTIASSLVGASHRVPMTSIRQRVIHQQSFQSTLV